MSFTVAVSLMASACSRMALLLLVATLASACGEPTGPGRPTAIDVRAAAEVLTALGDSTYVSANVLDQRGRTLAGASVRWSSTAPEIATVAPNGLVVAVRPGQTSIQAVASEAHGEVTITVAQQVTAVTTAPAELSIVQGNTARLSATALDAHGNAVDGVALLWATGDAHIATVDAFGLVTPVSVGRTEVHALSPLGPKGATTVTVDAPQDTFTYEGNPLFWGADPAAHVWADGQMWIYPTTDAHDWNTLDHWDAWSSRDLRTWVVHRDIMDTRGCSWCVNNAWAPDVAYWNGRYYMFYYFNNGGHKPSGVGVGVSDVPEGPFTNLTKLNPLVDGHDPAVFIDDDGQGYLYVGEWVYYLNNLLTGFQLRDGQPRRVFLTFEGQGPVGKWEAPWMFKRDGRYYFSVADDDDRRISYFVGDTPTGPFRYGGTILAKVDGLNVHQSIVKWHDRWILFFHLWPKDGPGQRRIYAEYLTFDADGGILPVTVDSQGVGG